MTAVAAASSCLPFPQDFHAVQSAKAGTDLRFAELSLLSDDADARPELLLTHVTQNGAALFSNGGVAASSFESRGAAAETQGNVALGEHTTDKFHTTIGSERPMLAREIVNSARSLIRSDDGITDGGSEPATRAAADADSGSHSAITTKHLETPGGKAETGAVSPTGLGTSTDDQPDALTEAAGVVAGARDDTVAIAGAADGKPQRSTVMLEPSSGAKAANADVGERAAIAGVAIPNRNEQVHNAPGTDQRSASIDADRRVGPIAAEPSPQLSSAGPRVKTLQQALARTYQTNPVLMARRAEVRGLDSAVALERAAGNPQLIAGATLDQELHITRPLGARGRNLSATAEASQIVYAGGRIRNSVQAARIRVIAGRADLRATEGDLLTEAVEVYADVLRDREIRDLNLAQVRILQENLESTRARFRVRDLTLADVAQSEARLDVVQSNLATAEGRLQASEENFERVVGARAGELAQLPPLPPLPLTSDQAVEATLANNADIAVFAARARAADYDVGVARSERSPTLSVVGSADYDDALGTADRALGLPAGTAPNSETNIRAGLLLRVPLYQGGAPSARVRQAEESRIRQVEEAIAIERLAVAGARTAFSLWRSALTAASFNELAVVANQKALESVKVEQTVGARSILDVLNAEQELLSSKISLTSARRDSYVTAFQLLDTMGAAEAADLNLEAGPLYDPRANYRRYSDTWSDWADGPRRPPASTRNVTKETDSPITRLNNGTLGETELED